MTTSTLSSIGPAAPAPVAGRAIQTNADGRFALLGAPEGPQTLRVQYVGYASRSLTLRADTLTGPLVVIMTKAVVRLSTTTVMSATDQSVLRRSVAARSSRRVSR